ncbi:MAG TPA: glycosyltransferase, partial [Planctomycetaceae bacterium]|nr:glycosyltransferase [Planctomycetaceae bacterium]
MPCLNEAETLGRCIVKAQAALDAAGLCGEIVVADNGSSDGSQDIAGGLRPPDAARGADRASAVRIVARRRSRRGPLRGVGSGAAR